MTNTADLQATARPEPPYNAGERATLTGFLDWQRATLEWKCSGLTAGQLARRAVTPSALSLLGIVRHLADVENGWFALVAGNPETPVFSTDSDPDADFRDARPEDAAVAEAFAAWHSEVDRAREIVATARLDATFARPRTGELISLRWVLAHMIEEYARHNGHADLLREAIDGQTGE